MYREIKYTKYLNQNVTVTKRTSIVDNYVYCSNMNETQSKCDVAINHQRALRIKFHDHFLTFLSVAEKSARCREVILAVVDTP